jgi:hypothetical protein
MKINWTIMNVEDAKISLNNIIKNEDKLNKVTVNQEGVHQCYFINREKLNRLATVSSISTCYNEDTARTLIVRALNDNLEDVVNWLIRSDAILKLKVNNSEPIGYQLNNRKEIPCNNAFVTIRRDIGYETEYGFYVASVVPVTI